jgi:hypothetical protein
MSAMPDKVRHEIRSLASLPASIIQSMEAMLSGSLQVKPEKGQYTEVVPLTAIAHPKVIFPD